MTRKSLVALAVVVGFVALLASGVALACGEERIARWVSTYSDRCGRGDVSIVFEGKAARLDDGRFVVTVSREDARKLSADLAAWK